MFPQQEPKLIEMQSFLADNDADRKWLKKELIQIAKDNYKLECKVVNTIETCQRNYDALNKGQKLVKANLHQLESSQTDVLRNQDQCNNEVQEIKKTAEATLVLAQTLDRTMKQILYLLVNHQKAEQFEEKGNVQQEVLVQIASQSSKNVLKADQDVKKKMEVLQQEDKHEQKLVSVHADEEPDNDGSIIIFRSLQRSRSCS